MTVLRDNRSLLAQAAGVHEEYAPPSRYGPPEPTGSLDALRARRDLLLAQASLTNREAQELAKLVAVLTRAEDRRRRPIQHGAAGYRRNCRCPVCCAGHAERVRQHRKGKPSTST